MKNTYIWFFGMVINDVICEQLSYTEVILTITFKMVIYSVKYVNM